MEAYGVGARARARTGSWKVREGQLPKARGFGLTVGWGGSCIPRASPHQRRRVEGAIIYCAARAPQADLYRTISVLVLQALQAKAAEAARNGDAAAAGQKRKAAAAAAPAAAEGEARLTAAKRRQLQAIDEAANLNQEYT